MKIGVISDTHGSVAAWQTAAQYFTGADLIIHAGDLFYHGPRNPFPAQYGPGELAPLFNNLGCPLVVARGNCDAAVDQLVLNWPIQNPYALVVQDGLRLVIHHGDGLNQDAMLALAQRCQARCFITGHTHIPLLIEKNGIILFNPGSPALPKGPEGPTIGVITTEAIQLLSLPEGKILKTLQL